MKNWGAEPLGDGSAMPKAPRSASAWAGGRCETRSIMVWVSRCSPANGRWVSACAPDALRTVNPEFWAWVTAWAKREDLPIPGGSLNQQRTAALG